MTKIQIEENMTKEEVRQLLIDQTKFVSDTIVEAAHETLKELVGLDDERLFLAMTYLTLTVADKIQKSKKEEVNNGDLERHTRI